MHYSAEYVYAIRIKHSPGRIKHTKICRPLVVRVRPRRGERFTSPFYPSPGGWVDTITHPSLNSLFFVLLLAGLLAGLLACWLAGLLAGWLAGWLACFAGWLGLLAGLLACWLTGLLAGWLAGWSFLFGTCFWIMSGKFLDVS